jgi:hypothetical protein
MEPTAIANRNTRRMVFLLILSLAIIAPAAVHAGNAVIDNPTLGGYGLDYCREWSKDCGWPAAHAFCQAKGYSKAVDFRWVKDNQKTRVITGGQVCDAPSCDRISRVVCQRIATFDDPRVNGYGLDYCREWAKDCGWPAATAFCRSQGYVKAVDFRWVKNNQKTRVIASGQVCNAPQCDRISHVTCE